MTLHELFTLMILPIGTSGTNEIQYMKYISEYISKLQIHQHGKDILLILPHCLHWSTRDLNLVQNY